MRNSLVILVKFGYSEKATKFEKIFHLKYIQTLRLWTCTLDRQ